MPPKTFTFDRSRDYVRARCPCGGEYQVGQTTEGEWNVLHTEPACPAFLALEPLEFLRTARFAGASRLPDDPGAPSPVRDLGTRDNAEHFVEHFVCETVTDWYDRHGSHPLAIYVFATRSYGDVQIPPGAIGVICLLAKNADSDTDKDRFLTHVRHVVEASRAIGVVTVMEVWALACTQKEYEAFAGPLEHHPRREEMVLVFLEHVRTTGRWVAPIHRQGEKVTLGAFSRQGDEVLSDGRFADLLQKQRFV